MLTRLWSRLSLVIRVMFSAGFALAVAGTLLLYISTKKDAEFSRTQIGEHLANEMESLLPAISEWAVIGDYANIEQTLKQRVKRVDIRRVVWVNTKGQALEVEDKPNTQRAPAWFVHWINVPAPQATHELLIGGRNYGSVTVTMSAATDRDRLWDSFFSHLTILALAVGLDLMGILIILRNGLRPLAALDEGARALEGGDVSTRILPQGSPELAHVITAFNRMAESVETTQNELHQSLDRLALAASVFENSLNGVTITDAEQRIIEVNAAFSRITGYKRDEVLGQTTRLLSSGRHDAEFYAAMWVEIRTTGQWRGEIWNRHKDGNIYPEELSIVSVRDEKGDVIRYIGIFSDISQVKEQETQLKQMAHYDPLTGLPNRALLADRMQAALAQAERSGEKLAVCYLDLDGFKPVNDTFGHATGDRLLEEMAERLRGMVSGGDDTVARLGGDEFALLLTSLADAEECEAALSHILKIVAQPVLIDSAALTVTASIGVTLYPDDGADADTLLRHADQAMYVAKEAGRNRHHLFDPLQDIAAREHRTFLARLDTALAQGEFCLYYQPKVDMRTSTVIGTEALIRWNHPEQGIMLPGEFLPLLEGSELEIRIGEWVIGAALTQMKAWRASGLDLPVSVNIAPAHLARIDFAEKLKDHLDLHPGMPENRLELEILESATLEDIDHVSRMIKACRRIGAPFSLDDFGTGYSSLTYLKRLPADTLKIDQSFVRDMLTDSDDKAIVDGIIGLTKAFRLSVIAEGVESLEHGQMLLDMGCFLAQGHGISRPMPAKDLPAWVAAWHSAPAWAQAATA